VNLYFPDWSTCYFRVSCPQGSFSKLPELRIDWHSFICYNSKKLKLTWLIRIKAMAIGPSLEPCCYHQVWWRRQASFYSFAALEEEALASSSDLRISCCWNNLRCPFMNQKDCRKHFQD